MRFQALVMRHLRDEESSGIGQRDEHALSVGDLPFLR